MKKPLALCNRGLRITAIDCFLLQRSYAWIGLRDNVEEDQWYLTDGLVLGLYRLNCTQFPKETHLLRISSIDLFPVSGLMLGLAFAIMQKKISGIGPMVWI